jgi:PAS domain S-box-containing protein
VLDCAAIYLVDPGGACDLAAHVGLGDAALLAPIRHYDAEHPLARRLLRGEELECHEAEPGEPGGSLMRAAGLHAELAVLAKAPDGSVLAAFIVGSHVAETIAVADRSAVRLLALQAGAAFARILADERCRSAEAKYETLVESIADTVFTADADGRLTYVSPQVQAMLGITPDELIGRHASHLLADADVKKLTRGLGDDESTAPLSSVVTVSHADGSRRDIRIMAVSAKVAGEYAGVIGTATDVTEVVRAERRSRRTLERLRLSVDAAVRALSRVVEMRDPYTAGHQERVTRLALAIGADMGLVPRKMTSLRIAAAIHDLGKIAVPGEILTKPGSLEEAEWLLLRQHPDTAFGILSEMHFPGPVAHIIRDHHERLDGSGYPRGLEASQIKLESRILAVADVVEAMSAHRPYRPALGIDAAIAETEAGRGTRYDVGAVDTCVRLLRHEGFSFAQGGAEPSAALSPG